MIFSKANQFFLRCAETNQTKMLRIVYASFKSAADTKKIQSIFTDKDIQNIELMGFHFKGSKIYLCTFRVIKWFRTVISKEDISTVK